MVSRPAPLPRPLPCSPHPPQVSCESGQCVPPLCALSDALPLTRMGSVNLVVIVESARTLITRNSDDDTNTLHVPSLIAVGAALGWRAEKFQR